MVNTPLHWLLFAAVAHCKFSQSSADEKHSILQTAASVTLWDTEKLDYQPGVGASKEL